MIKFIIHIYASLNCHILHHVSNLKAWKDPIAGLYNVRAIPATFLLDENGIIIAKNLRGPALVNKMASLFEN